MPDKEITDMDRARAVLDNLRCYFGIPFPEEDTDALVEE
jgi:hypothetical protein